MIVRTLIAAAVAGLVVSSAALAAEPGTSPLEQAAGAVASEVAGKTVRVRCHDQAGWEAIKAERGVSPTAAGFAEMVAGIAELGPLICSALDDVWTGSPPACRLYVPYTVTVKRTEWVKVKRRVRVRVAGNLVWRTRTVRVRRVVTRQVEREGFEPANCQSLSAHAFALGALAHEAWHLAGVREEAVAECYALQRVAFVSLRFGVSAADADALAAREWLRYPGRAGTPYHSPECRPDGTLDLTPGDGVWP